MNNKGYYGISFPFRVGVKGGVAMSGTNSFAIPHIEESIIQILSTNLGERTMEYHFGSNVSVSIFDPSDESANSLIKYEIVKALEKFEPRIEVETDAIQLKEGEITSEGNLTVDGLGSNSIVAIIPYKVKDYSNSTFYVKVNLGGDTNE